MSLDATATPAAGEALPVAPGADVIVPQVNTEPLSPREAGQRLAERRWQKLKEPEPDKPLSAEPAAPVEIPPQEEAADPAKAPGETTEQPDPAELPPIEPPRSWTTDEKDRFKTYPRELQAYLSEREQERDRDLRRRQNEAAEKLKAYEADSQAAQKARQEYETALPQLLQFVQQQVAGEFADVKTWPDVERMAVEDPIRHARWQVQQQKMAALHAEMTAAQQRQHKEQSDNWTKFAQDQDKLFADKAPDVNDPAKGPKLRDAAVNVLRDLGFAEQELVASYNGQEKFSLRDHRIQLLILDAVNFRDAKEKARQAPPKPVPPVQRPGASQQRPSAGEQALQALNQRLEQSGKAKDAAALIMARRAARR